MKTILSVVGARPQFIKAAPLSRRLRQDFREVLVHTGQHYDREMSSSFFSELDIPRPDVNLEAGSGPHGEQTRLMTAGLTAIIREQSPDVVVAYGDTNSTLAAGLAAMGCGIPLAHVEAGLRSFNREMPEEINRLITDHLSRLCLCPTEAAVANLEREGLASRAILTGDVMLDACLQARERIGHDVPARYGLIPGKYCLATVHRAENTSRPIRLLSILKALGEIPLKVAFPVHPRTRAVLSELGAELPGNVLALPPASYLETIGLAADAHTVLTDSGGLQKEAYFLSVPCVTLREETEWTETTQSGWNILAGSDVEAIVLAVEAQTPPEAPPDLSAYGGGAACERIAHAIHLLAGSVSGVRELPGNCR